MLAAARQGARSRCSQAVSEPHEAAPRSHLTHYHPIQSVTQITPRFSILTPHRLSFLDGPKKFVDPSVSSVFFFSVAGGLNEEAPWDQSAPHQIVWQVTVDRAPQAGWSARMGS